jgi:hypothetical protein
MQEKYSIANHLAGTVHIDHATGALSWDQSNLDPVIQKYVKGISLMKALSKQLLGCSIQGLIARSSSC